MEIKEEVVTKEIIDLLNELDYCYEMSDDTSRYSEGNSTVEKITRLVKENQIELGRVLENTSLTIVGKSNLKRYFKEYLELA